MFGLAVELAIGLAFGLGRGLTFGLVGGLTLGLVAGLTFGLVAGLMASLVVGPSLTLAGGSLKVNLTQLILAATGVGRVKFIRVLEDAHHRQVLRQAGAVYQFRHAELQDHLAEIHRRHTRLPTDT